MFISEAPTDTANTLVFVFFCILFTVSDLAGGLVLQDIHVGRSFEPSTTDTTVAIDTVTRTALLTVLTVRSRCGPLASVDDP